MIIRYTCSLAYQGRGYFFFYAPTEKVVGPKPYRPYHLHRPCSCQNFDPGPPLGAVVTESAIAVHLRVKATVEISCESVQESIA